MDAFDFHDQAMRDPIPAPVVTMAELTAYNEAQLRRHVTRIIEWVGSLYLPVTATINTASRMDATVEFNQVSLPGAKTIIGLTGPNGAGKSTMCHEWAGAFYRRQISSFQVDQQGLPRWQPPHGVNGMAGAKAMVAPVVWINLQAVAKIKELDVQILQSLRRGVSGTARDLTLRAVQALRDHRVRSLVIDDVHLLNLSVAGGRDVLDHLKHLNTELGEHGGSLVLIGANLERTELISDPQIATRLQLLRLPRYQGKNAAERATFREALASIETQLLPGLPAGKPGDLGKLDKRLYAESSGYLGRLIPLLKQAVILAHTSREGAITADGLDKL